MQDTQQTAFEVLLNSIQLASAKLASSYASLYRGLGISRSERLLLLQLEFFEQTVPQLAAQRDMSRQHIQGLVNRLLEKQLLQSRENPEHKRSVLIALSDAGKQVLNNAQTAEQKLLSELAQRFLEEDIELTSKTLRALAALLESLEKRV